MVMAISIGQKSYYREREETSPTIGREKRDKFYYREREERQVSTQFKNEATGGWHQRDGRERRREKLYDTWEGQYN